MSPVWSWSRYLSKIHQLARNARKLAIPLRFLPPARRAPQPHHRPSEVPQAAGLRGLPARLSHHPHAPDTHGEGGCREEGAPAPSSLHQSTNPRTLPATNPPHQRHPTPTHTLSPASCPHPHTATFVRAPQQKSKPFGQNFQHFLLQCPQELRPHTPRIFSRLVRAHHATRG